MMKRSSYWQDREKKNKKTSVATTILSLYTFVGIKIIVIVAVAAIYSILTLCFVFYVKSLLLHLKTVVGGRFYYYHNKDNEISKSKELLNSSSHN